MDTIITLNELINSLAIKKCEKLFHVYINKRFFRITEFYERIKRTSLFCIHKKLYDLEQKVVFYHSQQHFLRHKIIFN